MIMEVFVKDFHSNNLDLEFRNFVQLSNMTSCLYLYIFSFSLQWNEYGISHHRAVHQ